MKYLHFLIQCMIISLLYNCCEEKKQTKNMAENFRFRLAVDRPCVVLSRTALMQRLLYVITQVVFLIREQHPNITRCNVLNYYTLYKKDKFVKEFSFLVFRKGRRWQRWVRGHRA